VNWISPSKDDVYKHVQSLFTADLVVVVGSGASCAFDLPGMEALAQYQLMRLALAVPDLQACGW